MASKIFVGNLEFSTTKEQVEELFAQVGPVVDVFLPNDRATGRPRGFAFVEYESESDAETAIERFNGHELGGRALRVNPAEGRPGFGGGSRGPSFSGGGGFGGFGSGPPPGGKNFGGKPKGSRRNLRAKKRSL